jgi:hypothetical protein
VLRNLELQEETARKKRKETIMGDGMSSETIGGRHWQTKKQTCLGFHRVELFPPIRVLHRDVILLDVGLQRTRTNECSGHGLRYLTNEAALLPQSGSTVSVEGLSSDRVMT